MPSRAELHFHLLPGVDDGPQTMEQAIELARIAVEDGTSTIVATPHIRAVEVAELPDRVREVQDALDRAGVPVRAVRGGELDQFDVRHVSQADLETIALGPEQARFVLLEAPLFDDDVDGLHAAANELRGRGFGVLLGHPERCAGLFEPGVAVIDRELAAGSRLQINGTSLLGAHGEGPLARALELARRDRAAIVASDAHRPTRGPILTRAREASLHAGIDEATVRWMVDEGPRRLLEEGIAPS